MACQLPLPIFAAPLHNGIDGISSIGDGKSIIVSYSKAYSPSEDYQVAYNIYFSTLKDDVFTEGPKYVTSQEEVLISTFAPYDTFYFAIRAMLWDPTDMELSTLPSAQDLATDCYFYPESVLTENITETSTIIPILDTTDFPPNGVITLNSEVIVYYNIDYGNNTLYTTPDGRGRYGTTAAAHEIDTPVNFHKGREEENTVIISTEADFHKPHYAFTEADGYRQIIKDVINTDLAPVEEGNAEYGEYDYTGYHQTSILDYFSGKCIGSYAGGEYGCADGYGKYKTKIRGLDVQKANIERQQMLLDTTGEPIVLIRRKWEGIKCNCIRSNQEHAQARCPICLGTSFVGGYDQFYNPKRSDGRLLVRFDPTNDDVLAKNRGYEQNFNPNAWTVVTPGIKDRDVLIRFYEDGTEEFRYEILNVNRNKLLFSQSGAQKFQLHRMDKTDIIYQWRAFRDTSNLPSKILTTVSMLAGHGPHSHEIVVNEKIVSLTQINQTTGTSASHNHSIINGVVQPVLGHTHEIVLL